MPQEPAAVAALRNLLAVTEGTHRWVFHRFHRGPLHPQWLLDHRDLDLLHISVPIQGVLDYRVGDGDLAVKPGEFLWVGPGVPHRARHRGRARALTCRLGVKSRGADTVSPLRRVVGPFARGADPGGHLRQVLSRLLTSVRDGDGDSPAGSAMVDHGLRYALAVLMEGLAPGLGSGVDGRVAALRDFLEQEVTARLSLTELAKRCDLSPKYLARAFQKRYGLSPTAYHLRCRLERGRHLLEESDLTVEAVAEATGFPDGATLSHAWRRHFGRPPGEFRNRTGGSDGKFLP